MREIEAIAELAARACDPLDPVRRDLTADLAATSGLHPTSVDRLIALWAPAWQRRELERALLRGLGAEAAAARAVGKVAVVAPGNLCVATWQAILEPLLVGNRVTVRPGSGDPRAAANLRSALANVDREMAGRIPVAHLDRDDLAQWQAWLSDVDALCVYGGDEAITAVLRLAARAQYRGRLRLHGEFRSIGLLDAALLQDAKALAAAAAGWAVDALVGDGRGCMSLRALWLVGAADATGEGRLREALGAAFAETAAALPPGALAPAWQASVALATATHELAVHSAAGNWLVRGDSWSLLGAPRCPLGAEMGPGGRALAVYRAGDAADLRAQLAPWRRRLSTASLAIATDPCELPAVAVELGVHRTCMPGAMQAPRADRAPDGHLPFAAFLRLGDSS